MPSTRLLALVFERRPPQPLAARLDGGVGAGESLDAGGIPRMLPDAMPWGKGLGKKMGFPFPNPELASPAFAL